MDKVALGKIVSAVGLKGDMKCHLYSSEPTWLNKAVFLLLDEDLKQVYIEMKRYPYNGKSNMCLCRLHSVNSIEDAKTLVGNELWIDRGELNDLPDDEFYFCDMVGKPVYEDDLAIDTVSHVHDFGAGIVFELRSGKYLHVKQVAHIGQEGIKL